MGRGSTSCARGQGYGRETIDRLISALLRPFAAAHKARLFTLRGNAAIEALRSNYTSSPDRGRSAWKYSHHSEDFGSIESTIALCASLMSFSSIAF